MVPAKKTRTAHNNVDRLHNIPEKPYRRPCERPGIRQLTLKKGTPETGPVNTGFS
jgi:hypothetical protein